MTRDDGLRKALTALPAWLTTDLLEAALIAANRRIENGTRYAEHLREEVAVRAALAAAEPAGAECPKDVMHTHHPDGSITRGGQLVPTPPSQPAWPDDEAAVEACGVESPASDTGHRLTCDLPRGHEGMHSGTWRLT